ncbi:MAG: FtsX-like permease family protein [Oscillospiraceae bacterium]|nr:FtsX-like permease family protein [Oscillospiraceae bacterium]
MFWRILKKDLRRKKTMNIILLLFVVLSAMFASAAVNNIVAVTGGLDRYVELAEVPETVVMALQSMDLEPTLRGISGVQSIKTEPQLVVMESGNFSVDGEKMANFFNITRLFSEDDMGVNYFTQENEIIKDVEAGHIYANATFCNSSGLSVGDKVKLDIGDTHMTFIFDGQMKDIIMGGASDTSPRILLSAEDYSTLKENPLLSAVWAENFFFVATDDPQAVRDALNGMDNVYVYDKAAIKSGFLYDIMLAFIMLVISVLLMIVSFAVIRFSVGFTIAEEFHEIGVMKAVGINNGSIRSLYFTKYLAIAAIGALIGFAVSVPLEKAMLQSVTSNIVLEGGSTTIMGLLCVSAVVLLILLFCWGCTRKVKKLSAIDAVRSGQTGERFGKKSIMHLGRSMLPSTGFLSCNDVLSSPKQFSLISLIFVFCMLTITSLSVFADSLASDNLVPFMGAAEHDLSVAEMSDFGALFTEKDAALTMKADAEAMLEREGMPGKVTISYGANFETFYRDKKRKICYFVTKGISAEELQYDAGSAPTKPDETALTKYALDALGAEIGDTITANINGTDRKLLITGMFSSFQGGGYAARMYEDFEIDPPKISSLVGLQITFDGNPDSKTIAQYQEKLKDIYNTDKIYTGDEMIRKTIGLSDSMRSMQHLMMGLTVIVIVLIAVLLERSFISKEKSEIALMKAVGISGKSITAQHTLRFVIVAAVASVIAAALTLPVSKPIFKACCSLAGSIESVKLDYNKTEIFVICPLLIIGVTAVSAMLTAFYTKTIKASDTASIE